jgi:hypothetical protein
VFRHRARSTAPQSLATTLPLPGTAASLPAEGVRASWADAARSAAALVAERPGLIAVALAGFLARGGLIPFILPFVAVPTVVGLGNFIGPTQITASGPTIRLLWLVAGLVAAVVLALAVGTVVGALSDIALYRAAAGAQAGRGSAGGGQRRPGAGTVLRVVLIRLLAMVPVGFALAWSANRIGMSVYAELVLPQDMVTPMVVRVLYETRDAVAIVIATWLAGELVGGLAVRHHLRRGGSVPRAFGGAVVELVRRPVRTVGGFAVGVAALVVTVAPLLGFAWLVFGGVRYAIGRDEITRLFAAAVLFVAAWAVALVVAGTVSALRGLLGAFDALRVPAPRASSVARVAPSGLAATPAEGIRPEP